LGALVAAHRADGGIVVAAVHELLGPEPSLALTVGA
jgi:ABC-type transport system involved in cytochrome c biogenesis ATPase subunit